MKADLLSLLTAKSMSYELSSGNHDAVTSQDISHFLGTRGLDNREYDLLMAKYTDNSYARSMVFDDIYEEVCDIFLKYISADQIRKDKYLIRHFINLALREVILTVCPFCHGRGVIKTKNSIDKCYHCEGTGQFIYDDDNRPEFLGIDKEEYKKFKKPYMETLNFVKNIEINALAKIGDE
jgi:hypothetical protein|tara:strand:- start:1099 stop:1638 length:540 start_codon:yes stop_codon:yes gene_type:complete